MSILYLISGCYKCEKAKEVLTSKQIPFKEVNLFDFPERIREIKQINGEVVTPLFYSKGKKGPNQPFVASSSFVPPSFANLYAI